MSKLNQPQEKFVSQDPELIDAVGYIVDKIFDETMCQLGNKLDHRTDLSKGALADIFLSILASYNLIIFKLIHREFGSAFEDKGRPIRLLETLYQSLKFRLNAN